MILKICKTMEIHSSFDLGLLFENFVKRYQFLAQYAGLGGLLEKFSQDSMPKNICDIITEFNLAYEILQGNPTLSIEYEPKIVGNSKHPDFMIKGINLFLYIQVKRMRKSYDLKSQMEKAPESETWYAVEDEKQIRKALHTACKFCPLEPEAIFIVVQEIENNANIGDITLTEAVYGKELWDLKNSQCTRRAKDGFFFSESGDNLLAYIALRRNDSLRFCENYHKTLFINPKFFEKQETIRSIFDFQKTYDFRSLPDD